VPPIPPLPPAQVVPGDLLSITVRDAPELSREYRVLGDGSIRLPLIASPVRVSGLGAEGAAAAVADAIQKGAVISDPQVGVSVLAQADRVKMAPWPVWRKPLPLIQPQAQTNRADRLKQELASPWLKWVNEDVAYIIQDQERAAFLSLGTDEEREHFVEQFWERRDPTPGTPENEFKVEHYRRIAYTNAHFSDAALPGWKTDMGRIYITYGPPDEIDSHRADATPWEQWKYRFIQGVGNNVLVDFRDADHSGRMRMTMDPSRGAVPPAPDLPVVAVRKTADGIVVDLALNPEKSFSVLVRITTPERRPVATLERVVNRESRAELPFALKPGSYRLHVVEKDRSDGSIVDRETDLVI
jgi:GWxTD domain-containing protein